MYNIKVDEEQMRVMADALDIYSRLKCGQIKMISDLFFEKDFDMQALDYCALQMKIILFPELEENSYYGIYGDKTPEESKVAYDIYKNIRHHLQKGARYWSVDSDEHLLLASGKPVKIEKVK